MALAQITCFNEQLQEMLTKADFANYDVRKLQKRHQVYLQDAEDALRSLASIVPETVMVDGIAVHCTTLPPMA
jgi:hypothetical protein